MRFLLTAAFMAGLVAAPAAACAQGWYLMVPPGDPPRAKLGEFTWSVPLHEWRQAQGFDRANDCEASRALHIQIWDRQAQEAWQKYSSVRFSDEYLKAYGPDSLEILRRHSEGQDRELARSRMAQCISAVDPRLAPKPAR
jgi:hypothetical protein